MSEQAFNTILTALPICPHCGASQLKTWEYDFTESTMIDTECDSCNEPILIEKIVTVDYCTYPRTI